MELMTANEFLQEDGHAFDAPSYDTVRKIFDELSRETLGENTFYADFTSQTLAYGEELDQKIDAEQWERIGYRCGLVTSYVKKIALDYAEEQKSWADLW